MKKKPIYHSTEIIPTKLGKDHFGGSTVIDYIVSLLYPPAIKIGPVQLALFILFLIPVVTNAAKWETRADGNWNSSTVWKLNGVNTTESPSIDFWTNDSIYIYHDITFNFSGDVLNVGKEGEGTGLVVIDGGSFFSSGDNQNDVKIALNGELNSYNGYFELGIFRSDGQDASGGLVDIRGTVYFANSTIKVVTWHGQKDHDLTLINSDLYIGQNYQSDQGVDYLEDVCISMGLHGVGNFNIASGGASVTCLRCDILWPDEYNASGDFNNSSEFLGVHSGYDNEAIGTLYLRNGNLTNSGTWTAAVNTLYVSETISGVPTEYLPPLGNKDIVEDQEAASSASCAGVPLPIQLMDFTGETMHSFENHLFWTTASEINSDYFEIQRQTDDPGWTTIGLKHAKGHSNEKIKYSFVDLTPASGNNYYRLKMVDKDKTFDFSRIVVLRNKIRPKKEFTVYPIPASGQINLMYEAESSIKVDIKITNQIGQVVQIIEDHVFHEGTNRKQIDLQGLSPGWYSVQILGPGMFPNETFIKK